MVSGPHPQFPHLFAPLALNGVTLHNRVAISDHFAGWYVGPGGLLSDELAAYIAERGGEVLFLTALPKRASLPALPCSQLERDRHQIIRSDDPT